MDPTLRLRGNEVRALDGRRIHPERFSRRRLFEGMLNGQIRLFRCVPVQVETNGVAEFQNAIIHLIRSGFPKSARARVQMGRARMPGRLRVGHLMDRWEGRRAIISVTDLHIRGTRFGRTVDISALSNFNILAGTRSEISVMEMMTVLVGSTGNVTDSHTDDCDGSNHCFVGQKLWLIWDRLEGKAAGLQDVERDPVPERAAFNMRTFLSLPSARWLLINPGETVFLPGNMAHKVLTMAHYIGIGSFYLAFPNAFRSFTRWSLDGTIDINQSALLDKMIRAVTRRILALRESDNSNKERMGWRYLRQAAILWNKRETAERRARMLQNPTFRQFVTAVLKVGRPTGIPAP
jgi:hypothetical protein